MPRSKSRRTVAMTVVVTVPIGTTHGQARLEVRTLINEQCNWKLDPGEVKVQSIRPSPLTTAKSGKGKRASPPR